MLRDDHASYYWFFLSLSTNAVATPRATIDWPAAFGVPHGLMSDEPMNFRNKTVRYVMEGLKTSHHFRLSYSHWIHGAIERLWKEVRCVVKRVFPNRACNGKNCQTFCFWIKAQLICLSHQYVGIMPKSPRWQVSSWRYQLKQSWKIIVRSCFFIIASTWKSRQCFWNTKKISKLHPEVHQSLLTSLNIARNA